MEAITSGDVVLVNDDEPGSTEPGCEGQPNPVLFRSSLDGGAREPVRVGGKPIYGTVALKGWSKALVLESCEEFVSALFVVDLAQGGGRRLPLPEPGSTDLQVEGLSTPTWSFDGRSLLCSAPVGTAGAQRAAVRIDAETGAIAELFRDPKVHQVGELQGGRLVTADEGAVRLREPDGTVVSAFEGDGFEIDRNGFEFAVYGPRLLTVSREGHHQDVVAAHPGVRISAVAWSSNQRVLAYAQSVGEMTQIFVAIRGESPERIPVSEPGRYGRPAFSPDSTVLAYNLFGSAPEFRSTVVIVRAS